MKYKSTRDPTKLYTFEEALFSGYAPDGGLFVPEELPSEILFPPTTTKNSVLSDQWPGLGYLDLATEVLHPFLGTETIARNELKALLRDALAGFDTNDKNLVPVVPLVSKHTNTATNKGGDKNGTLCYVAELFHGPTYCFKDLGMRATINLLDYFANKSAQTNGIASSNAGRTKKVVLTAATTGDTGPAAVRAVQDRNSPSLGIVVHYPEGQISDFQRKQMTTVQSDRVRIVSFEGGGDDMDRPIKRIMTSSCGGDERDPGVVVCGVNSYNIGRPLMQMVHFVWTYLRVIEYIEKETGEPIDHGTFRLDIVIPTGAMGNLAGCYMAKKLGIPFGRMCAGVNVNDFTDRTFRTGLVKRADTMKPSLSDAINIQLPYNLERLLFYATGGDHEQVRNWYQKLEGGDAKSRWFDLSETSQRWWNQLQAEFKSARVTDDELCVTIRRVLEDYGYWADPHTGVAFAAAEKLGYNNSQVNNNNKNTAVAIMATASPCKFQNVLTVALGPRQWNEYEREHFPSRGKDLDGKPEIPPVMYAADRGKTLEENQIVWEAKTRELIDQLGK